MRTGGYSLLEVLVVVAILGVLATLAIPSVQASRNDARARSAADHVSSLLHGARLEALKRHVNVALRFEAVPGGVRYVMYADDNGNGVRSADIDAGIDRPIRPGERIEDQFPGVRFAIDESASAVESDEPATTDGIRLGRSRMVSFSPTGTSSSGTVYLLGRGRRQFAVRVLGPTGRIRALEYNFGSGAWQPR